MADKILASVGTLTVTEREVDEFIINLGQRGQSYNSPEGRAVILNQLINNKLLLLDARRNLYEADARFREELAKMKDQLLINFAAEKAFGTASVSEDEAKAYYEENKAQFSNGDSVTASHILVDSFDKANEILAKINAGEITFENAAKEYSTCPSGENGGSLGEFGRGQMVPEFDKAVFSMEAGEISKEPVKTQFGFHLIKLDAKKTAEPLSYTEVSDKIKAMLMGEKQRKAYESKINQLKILYPVDMMV